MYIIWSTIVVLSVWSGTRLCPMTRLLCNGRGHHLLSIIYLSTYFFLFFSPHQSFSWTCIYTDHVEHKHNKERTEWAKQMAVQKWSVMMMMMMIYVFLYLFDMMCHLLIFIIRLIVSSGIGRNRWEKHLSDILFYTSSNWLPLGYS